MNTNNNYLYKFCDSCDFCDFCDSCDFCDYCKNLRMTEFNVFCWSEKYNNDNSFQQKRYRVFNVQLTEDEYRKIKVPRHKLEFNPDDNSSVRFSNAFKKMWDNLTPEEQQEYLDIPHFSWEGFTFITGVTPDMVKQVALVERLSQDKIKKGIEKLTTAMAKGVFQNQTKNEITIDGVVYIKKETK